MHKRLLRGEIAKELKEKTLTVASKKVYVLERIEQLIGKQENWVLSDTTLLWTNHTRIIVILSLADTQSFFVSC